MGLATDRFGGVPVAAAGMVVLVAAVLVAGLSGASHSVTVAGLILLGVGWSAATVAGSSLLAGAVPVEERLGAQGTSDALMSLAGGLGGLAAGAVIALIGYEGLGVSCAAIAVVALGVLLTRRGGQPLPGMADI
jgi:predicted MFS family arabinose efflux permease